VTDGLSAIHANLVCAIWIGFDDNKQLGLTGAEAALPAWVEFMKAAIDLRPELGGKSFDQPRESPLRMSIPKRMNWPRPNVRCISKSRCS
jgi:membrane carboxypeptidase/penicillin-binding protein